MNGINLLIVSSFAADSSTGYQETLIFKLGRDPVGWASALGCLPARDSELKFSLK